VPKALNIPVLLGELLAYAMAVPKKPGPHSQSEKQMAAIASLRRKEQQQLLAVVERSVISLFLK
jgi:hypothetical protein